MWALPWNAGQVEGVIGVINARLPSDQAKWYLSCSVTLMDRRDCQLTGKRQTQRERKSKIRVSGCSCYR